MNQTQLSIIPNEPLLDFGIQLLATLIGVGLGFWLPVRYEKYRKNKETNLTKIHIINSVISELEVIERGLKDPEHNLSQVKWDDTKQTFVGRYGIASAPMIHSAINTGNIILFDEELREALIRISDRIEHYNWFIKQLLTFYTTPIFATGKGATEARDLIFRTKQQIDYLEVEIKEVLDVFKQ